MSKAGFTKKNLILDVWHSSEYASELQRYYIWYYNTGGTRAFLAQNPSQKLSWHQK